MASKRIVELKAITTLASRNSFSPVPPPTKVQLSGKNSKKDDFRYVFLFYLQNYFDIGIIFCIFN